MASERIVRVNNRNLSYFEYGDPKGEALFFFHGWPGSGRQGAVLDSVAQEIGVRVISISRPGILGSDLVPGRRLADWPKLVECLADHLKIDRFRVLGVSGGGPYALSCAWGLGEKMDQVVVVCGAPLLSLSAGAAQLLWVYRVLLWLRNHSRLLLNLVLNSFRLLIPLGIHRIAFKLLARSLPERDRYALFDCHLIDEVSQSFEDHLGSGAEALISDAEIYLQHPGFELASISQKVIFWHGELDRNIPISVGRKMAAMLPNTEFHVSANDGHYSLALLEAGKILRWMYKKSLPSDNTGDQLNA